MLYKIALFLHVTGALMLCAAIAIEWLCIINIRKANTIDRIKETAFYYSKVGIIGDIGAFMILIPGIYMMVTAWKGASWIIIGFIGLVLIGVIGGAVTGKKFKTIGQLIKSGNDNLREFEVLLKNNSLWFSIKMRTAILLGVVFLMTVKPELAGSIIAIVLSIILGALSLRMKYDTVSQKR